MPFPPPLPGVSPRLARARSLPHGKPRVNRGGILVPGRRSARVCPPGHIGRRAGAFPHGRMVACSFPPSPSMPRCIAPPPGHPRHTRAVNSARSGDAVPGGGGQGRAGGGDGAKVTYVVFFAAPLYLFPESDRKRVIPPIMSLSLELLLDKCTDVPEVDWSKPSHTRLRPPV